MTFAAFAYGFCRICLWLLPHLLMTFVAFAYDFCRICLWLLPHLLMACKTSIMVEWLQSL
jgi:hypothetical protein